MLKIYRTGLEENGRVSECEDRPTENIQPKEQMEKGLTGQNKIKHLEPWTKGLTYI